MSKVLKQGQTFTGSARVRVYQPEPGMPGQAGTGESTDGTENQEADSAGAGGQDTAGKRYALISEEKRKILERPEAKAEQKVDEELMAGKLERFFGELSAAWEGKPKVLVRAVMSKILSRLPVFFDSLEEVRLYVEGSLRSCSDVKEKEISMGLIRMLMEQDKFDQEDY